MKFYWLITALLASSYLCFGQTPTASSTDNKSEKRPKLKNFGSSLKPQKDKDYAREPAQNGDPDVIRINTNLVRSDVLVIDQKGNPVRGLKKEDFVVSENKVSQTIDSFNLGSSEEVPRSIVLIFDYSGSQFPYLGMTAKAAKTLIDKLNPNDRMAIVNDDVKLVTDFTSDKKLLKRKIDDLTSTTQPLIRQQLMGFHQGRSLQFSALMATLNELFDDEDVRPIIILQSDGDEIFAISSVAREFMKKFGDPFIPAKSALTIERLFTKIQQTRATIYSVITGPSILGLTPEQQKVKVEADYNEKYWQRHIPEQTALETMAQTSGGFAKYLEKPEQADEIYTQILNELNYRYLIGYYPINQERDGSRRNVRIEVRGHPEYIVWGRKTYVAPDAQ